MDWHFIIKTLSGRSFLFVSTLDGDDVAFDSSRYENEFAVLNMLVLNRLVEKFGNPQLQHSHDIFFSAL